LVVGWTALVSRLVGECRRVAGDVDGARRWLALALDEARDLPLERAQVRLAQARLEVGDPGRAAALAGEALAELDRIGAVALLAPARQLAGAGPSPGTRVIVFTDLVDSTRSNVRIGDVRWAEVLDVHDRVVDRRLRLHAGVAFKHTGDGIAAWFADASDAVGFASGVLDDLARASAELDDVTLLARAGLSAGEPIGRGDDLFGLCVVTAGRLCDLADPGRILVSDDVARLLGSAGTRLRPLGPVALKGLPDPVPVHEVRAASPPVPVP
jgi:class 3 adenylate cyclase